MRVVRAVNEDFQRVKLEALCVVFDVGDYVISIAMDQPYSFDGKSSVGPNRAELKVFKTQNDLNMTKDAFDHDQSVAADPETIAHASLWCKSNTSSKPAP